MPRRRRLHPQEHDNTCAVASLRTALDLQFGVVTSEAALEALGTDARLPIATEGTGSGDLRRMVRGASFAYNTEHQRKPWRLTIRQRGSLSDLARHTRRSRIPIVTVVVRGVTLDDGHPGDLLHAVCVLAVRDRTTGTAVKVFDPRFTTARWYSALRFIRFWTQDNGTTEYAVVT